MSDFNFLQNPITKKWVISAPRRAKRPDEAKGTEGICPFCPENEKNEIELFRLDEVRVIPNKFPFAPIHEIIIHSSDHQKNFGELDLNKIESIFKTYRQRYVLHKDKGQVYIFHNRGEEGGESLPHPHSQLTVIPNNIQLEIKPSSQIDHNPTEIVQTEYFCIFCPETSDWPDEVWFVPKPELRIKNKELRFGDITDEQIIDLSKVITKLIKILELRHGKHFPYNFYIYPGKDWYLRLIPRTKSLGGFELGTGIFVNTQDPKETIDFLRKNFQ